MELIDSQSGDLPKDIFVAFANKIYKRNKWKENGSVSIFHREFAMK